MATIEIELTKGQVAYIDEEDYELVSQYSWNTSHQGHRRTKYATTNVRGTDGKYHTERMHRIILGLTKGDGIVVDHRNGNGLDNRRENLRTSTNSKNGANSATPANNKSGYKGVSKRTRGGKWVSQARKEGTKIVSYHECRHDAARAYNLRMTELFGEHAWLNEVEECDCNACSTSEKKATSS